MTEDEIVGWHHQLNGHEFERVLGHGEGQESLECCSPQGCKELDTTELLNNITSVIFLFSQVFETILRDLPSSPQSASLHK